MALRNARLEALRARRRVRTTRPNKRHTLPDIAATPATAITTIEGKPLTWDDTGAGISVTMPTTPAGN